MARYRRKVTEVEATRWLGPDHALAGVHGELTMYPGDRVRHYVVTAQGQEVTVTPGEWVVDEPDGSGHYPVSHALFSQLYTPCDGAPTDWVVSAVVFLVVSFLVAALTFGLLVGCR